MRNSLLLLGMLALLIREARADEPRLEGVVNLNTATPEELRLIPGVGPARVRNILAFRKTHPFRTVDELARIKGIGRKTVRRWRLHLAVAGPSTAQRVVRPDVPTVPPEQQPAGEVRAVHRPVLRAPARPSPRAALRRGEPGRAAVVRAPGVHGLPPR